MWGAEFCSILILIQAQFQSLELNRTHNGDVLSAEVEEMKRKA